MADLTVLNENVGRVLAVVAHPDDLEYGAAAAVARWTADGHHVVYCLATRGEAGIDGLDPVESGRLREAEQRASARVVGVEDVEFLDFADGVLEYGVPLRRAIARAIRTHRPDTLLLFNHREDWGADAGLNSPDHRAVGQAALDAIGDAGNRWIFTDLGLEPHAAKLALVAGSPRAAGAIDVTGYIDAGIASLAEHKAYLEGLGDHPMSDVEFLRGYLETAGAEAGVGAAVKVEVFRF